MGPLLQSDAASQPAPPQVLPHLRSLLPTPHTHIHPCPRCQVLLALADQRLFGEAPLPPGGTGEAWAEATAPWASIPWVPGECSVVPQGGPYSYVCCLHYPCFTGVIFFN